MIHLRFSMWIIHCSLPDIDACVQCMFLGLLFHLLMRFRFLHNNMEIFQGPNSNIKCCFQRENFWFQLWKSLAYTQNGSFRNSFLWPSYIIQWTQGCFQWVNLWFHLLKSLASTQNINFRNSPLQWLSYIIKWKQSLNQIFKLIVCFVSHLKSKILSESQFVDCAWRLVSRRNLILRTQRNWRKTADSFCYSGRSLCGLESLLQYIYLTIYMLVIINSSLSCKNHPNGFFN